MFEDLGVQMNRHSTLVSYLEKLVWTLTGNFANHGGALDFFISNAHIDELFPGKHYTREKFTYQLSDHLPIWLQMKTDIDGFRLEQIVQGGKG